MSLREPTAGLASLVLALVGAAQGGPPTADRVRVQQLTQELLEGPVPGRAGNALVAAGPLVAPTALDVLEARAARDGAPPTGGEAARLGGLLDVVARAHRGDRETIARLRALLEKTPGFLPGRTCLALAQLRYEREAELQVSFNTMASVRSRLPRSSGAASGVRRRRGGPPASARSSSNGARQVGVALTAEQTAAREDVEAGLVLAVGRLVARQGRADRLRGDVRALRIELRAWMRDGGDELDEGLRRAWRSAARGALVAWSAGRAALGRGEIERDGARFDLAEALLALGGEQPDVIGLGHRAVVHYEPAARLAALQALGAVGEAAHPARPLVVEVLERREGTSARVLQETLTTLAVLGPDPALRERVLAVVGALEPRAELTAALHALRRAWALP